MWQYAEENVAQVADEAGPLLMAHWNEVEAVLFGPQTYTLNVEHYTLLESLDMLSVQTLRNEKGTLCGYAVFVLCPSPHQEGDIIAQLDAFYLAPQNRGGFSALGLLKAAEKTVHERGAHMVQYSSPASRPCDALYRRLGAVHTESIWHKRLQ